MSFEQYVDKTAPSGAVAARFDHCAEQLPVYDAPTDAQKAEITAKANRIAAEIGAVFDADVEKQTPAISAMFTDMQRYATAQVPWGAMPTPPPIQLFQQLTVSLQHWLSTCQSYSDDALKLSLAGAPQFKAYLQQFIDDTSKALDSLKNTPTALMSSSPANFGAGPGPMSPFPPAFGMPGFPGMGMAPHGPGNHPWLSLLGLGLGIPPSAMMPPPPMPYPGMMPFPGGMPPGMMGPGMMPPMPFPAGPMAPMPATSGAHAGGAGGAAPVDPMIAEMKAETDTLLQMNKDRQKAFDDANSKFDDYVKS